MTIPYVIADGFDPAGLAAIKEGMSRWEAIGFKFQKLNAMATSDGPQDGGLVGAPVQLVTSGHVTFIPDSKTCCFTNGIGNAVTEVHVPPSGGVGLSVHEIGHVIGLQHEHTRSDRLDHIKIFPENIKDNYGVDQILPINVGDQSSPYDVDSIMHYNSDTFAKPGTSVMLRKDGSKIEHYDQLSPGDIAGAEKMYAPGCSGSTPPGPTPTPPPAPPLVGQ
jgi:hypothetical protein